MAENSRIEWTDNTLNFWWGCVKVSPGCEHCYAETLSKRVGRNIWGPAKTTDRWRTKGPWRDVVKWNAKAQAEGVRRRLFLELPALAIDELDKVNLRNEWIRERFQELMDVRYRSGVAGETLTLVTLQGEPSALLPGDIASRIGDGRFYRPWTGGRNSLVIDRWGEKVLPGCLHIEGKDARPNMAPAFVRAKRTHRNGYAPAKAVTP